jgi:alkylation response protein AidB-like acyl-CoA dehydrogenase
VPGLDRDVLEMTLEAIGDFAAHELPEKLLVDLDERDEFPADLVKRMCSEDLGVQLLFIPEEHGGMGGSAFDVYRVCERMAAIDLGVATSVLATFLGSDPIVVGGTPDQQARWLGRIAAEGVLVAYGATEPEAGSDLGALKTVAVPVTGEDGSVTAYRITGKKQWISNGGVADFYTVRPTRPAARPGSSSTATRPASCPESRRTSTGSASATPPPSSSTRSRCLSIGSSAASRARASSKPSSCSGTPA